MNKNPGSPFARASLAFHITLLGLLIFAAVPVQAGTSTWLGADGVSGKWQAPANWNAVPVAGDSLVFTGTARLLNTNDFDPGTAFSALRFSSPAGAFSLFGNSVSLTGDIVDGQTVLSETINLPLILGATRNIGVVSNGFLTLGGTISGAGGLTLTNSGTVTLAGSNTFSGAITINAGTLFITNDINLGAAPGSVTPGSIILNGGLLRVTNSLTLNSNRGIRVGPAAGILDIGTGTGAGTAATVTYGGVIADNGLNAGGLTKQDFGFVSLFGSNTFSGPTAVKNGTLVLNFANAAAPSKYIINPVSSLTLGGANSGSGLTNFASLVLSANTTPLATNFQAFNGTHIAIGPSVIQVTPNTGGASLSLGSLDHDFGGVVTIAPPSTQNGVGNITTTATNLNGVLGAFAGIGTGAGGINSTPAPFALACVDGQGNIVPFTNYTVFPPPGSSTLNMRILGGTNYNRFLGATNNLLITTNSSQTGNWTVRVDDDNAFTTNDINTITILQMGLNNQVSCLSIGTNNTLRLGRYGGIYEICSNFAPTIIIGTTNDASNVPTGQGNSQNCGTLTAGGPNFNSPGEIILMSVPNSTGTGRLRVTAKIADNGPAGAVTLIKAGPGGAKIDGHNTYSGGTYILDGIVQLSGNEPLNSTPNSGDGFGTGPVYIFPGAVLNANATTAATATTNGNTFFVAGSGGPGNAGGVIFGGAFASYTGPWNLIGDAVINSGVWRNTISGSFSVTWGTLGAQSGGQTATLMNSFDSGVGNQYTGNTFLGIFPTGTGINLVCSNVNVFPHGFGFGNFIVDGNANNNNSGFSTLDLRGFNQTVNGLGNVNYKPGIRNTGGFIVNSLAGSTATLTVGDNDQSSTWFGLISDSSVNGGHTSTTALTKIGQGTLTIATNNDYQGTTLVATGTLALAFSGQITNSRSILVYGSPSGASTFDVSGLTNGGFSTVYSLVLSNGVLVGNTSPLNGIGSLSISNNSALSLVINPLSTNIFATNLVTAGANVINILSVLPPPSGYPFTNTIIQYGTHTPQTPFNFTIGSVPSPTTGGFILDDPATSRILLVLTNGPKVLAWLGDDAVHPTFWDVATTTNWLAFGATHVPFFPVDAVLIDDGAGHTNVLDIRTTVAPSSIIVSNGTRAITFIGNGSIVGVTSLTKNGAQNLVMLETGGDSFRGGITVNGGSVILGTDTLISGGVAIGSGASLQVGTNGGTGTLPGGNAVDNGTLVFDRGADLAVNNSISGAGGMTKSDTSLLALRGANSFAGTLTIVAGTLQVGNSLALGATNGSTVISSGAMLDLNGFNVGAEPVSVAGTGISNNGAIVNFGADQVNALRSVTLTGDATFGGPGRWDIREGAVGNNDALLSGAFNITKISTNQISFVGVQATGIGNIIVQQGVFGVERGTTLPTLSTITVSNGATLEFFGNGPGAVHAATALFGNGVTPTVLENNGRVTLDNNSALNGTVIFSGNGINLTMSVIVSGSGNLLKTGSSQLTFDNGSITYGGSTVVSNGLLVIDANKSGGSGITIYTNAGLGGGGFAHTISENVTLNGGGIRPGNPDNVAQETFQLNGNLTMNSSSNVFDLNADVNTGNDKLAVSGNLSMAGTNVFRITVVDHLTAGDTYTLVTYGGTPSNVDGNHIAIVPPPFGYAFQLVDPTTTPGEIRIQVTLAIGFDFWVGNDPVHPTFWDVGVTTNWDRNGANSFKSNDFACFSDQGRAPNANSTNITLIGKVTVAGLIFTNGTYSYELSGSGNLSGGGLILEGGSPGGGLFPTVTIANSGSNDWTGGVLIDANADLFGPAQLNVGDGSANGNLGFGTITNDGVLVFNHGGDYTNALLVGNNIVNGPDSGFFGAANGITNIGSGVVVLSGNSTFTNEVDIINGTVVAGSQTALGLTNGGVVIVTNATLDFTTNAVDLGLKRIIVSGSGVNSNGAIVNNSHSGPVAFAGPNFALVTLAGDTVIGGNSRLDWRANPATGTNATLITGGHAYNLTKISTNQLQLAGLIVDPALANIDVQGGIFGVQGAMTSLGNPTNSLTIYSNATLAFFQVSNVFNKVLVLKDGSIVNNNNGTNKFGGPVVLQGSAIFDVGGTRMTLTNTISGTGSLIKISGNELRLEGANTFNGNTIISNGLLTLAVNVTLNNCPEIDLAPSTNTATAILDVTERSDSKLTIISAQTLKGAGIVRGSLTVNNGGMVSPGHLIGAISVTTNVTLNGATLMDIDAGSVANDQINCTNTISGTGTLVVTNINGTLAVGQAFRLFRAGTYTGLNFSSVVLPTGLPPGAFWTNTIAIDGTIRVAAPPQNLMKLTIVGIVSNNLIASVTNGLANASFRLLSSTNITVPLSNWTVVGSNVLDGAGGLPPTTFTNAAVGTLRFYTIQVP